MSSLLEVKKITCTAEDKVILKNLSLTLKAGETHVIMGPNGSGKSTLALSIMGHPAYTVQSGSIVVARKNITKLAPEKRATSGIFLAFQNPQSLAGVSVLNFLHLAYNNITGKKNNILTFTKIVEPILKQLALSKSFLERSVNDNFSGGEKKKLEVLQLLLLKPKLAMLDETDSGLDLDALKIVARGINELRHKSRGFLVITHYQRLLDYIKPDVIHVLMSGSIVASGGHEIVKKIDRYGYKYFNK